jgi:uncharacterized protein (TIGR02145 family)
MGTTGISQPSSPTSTTKAFSGWTKGGTGTLSGTTWTFGAGNGTLTANWASSASFNLPSLSKTGHNCKWAEGSTSGTQYSGGTARTITGDTTYYAVCSINQYTLTVNPNGGTWNNTTSSSSITRNYGTTYTVANPTTTATWTISYDMGTTGITKPTSPTSTTKAFSGWTKGGTGTLSGTTWTFGAGNGSLSANWASSASFNLPALSKTGHNCQWAAGSTSGTKYNGGASATISGNTTFYAVCTINQYTLTINANGGTYTPATVTQNYNTTYTLGTPTSSPTYTVSYDMNSTGITKPTSPTSATRAFSSWSKSSGTGSLSGSTWTFGAGDGAVIANWGSATFTLPSLSKDNYDCQWAAGSTSGTKYNGGASATISGNTTFYAVCTYKPLLTVDPNGGTWNSSTSTQTFRAAPNSTKSIANPSANATYSITYNDNSQGATYTGSPTTASRSFTGWSKSGGGSISGTTYTYGTTDGTLTAGYNSTSDTFTLPTITKSGFTCKWAKGSATSSTKYDSGATGVTITANTTFYAVCESNVPTMQNFTATQCTNMNQGDTVTLQDTRTGTSYVIKKGRNHCWMTSDLIISNKTLTSADSDVSSNFTLPASSSQQWTSDTSTARLYSHSYTTYYNWYAATAGTGNSLKDNGVASSSICPKGWHLPHAEYPMEIYDLMTTTDYVLPLHGYFKGTSGAGSITNVNEEGYVWSSEASGSTNARSMYYWYDWDYEEGDYEITYERHRNYDGLPIRCVAYANALETISNLQEMTNNICAASKVGDSVALTDTRDDTTYWVTHARDGHCWIEEALQLHSNFTASSSNSDTTSGTLSIRVYDSLSTYGSSTGDVFTRTGGDGSYMSWYTANLGTTGNTQSTKSVCPKGFTMPLGLSTLLGANTVGDDGRTDYQHLFPLAPATEGYISGSTVYNTGDSYIWTRDSSNSSTGYVARFHDSTHTRTTLSKSAGASVMCLSK